MTAVLGRRATDAGGEGLARALAATRGAFPGRRATDAGGSGELRRALAAARGALMGVALFSAAVNLLMLTGPLFMLQVYDRVLASRSSATLAVLFGIVVFLFALMGLLDHVRGRVLARVGAGFQAGLDARVFAAVLRQAAVPALRERPAGALANLAAIRTALASPGIGAAFDLPWTPAFVGILFLFHPSMGWCALAGAVVVLALALLNQARTRAPQAEAVRRAAEAEARTEITRKGIETVQGLGMTAAMGRLWRARRDAALGASMAASDAGGGLAAATKAVRLMLQSAILGLGALLVLRGELTAGAMIAGAILLGRALAPLEQTIGHLPHFQRALTGWRDLGRLLAAVPPEPRRTALPRPEPRLALRDLAVVPPGATAPVVQGVGFSAGPGDAVAVIGPSAAGKSALARALVGLWPPARGEIRLAGADLHQYERDRLGAWLGYLPQEALLFPGTVAQNIARFDPEAGSEAVIAAARQAAAHEAILALPRGYDTVLTEGGGGLSGGQRQRIGLARAYYGEPVMLVLDEPDASLDDPGLQALNQAIGTAREAGRITLVMSHRPSALAQCNLVLVLEAGAMRAFGPREEVMRRFVRPVPSPVAAGPRRSG